MIILIHTNLPLTQCDQCGGDAKRLDWSRNRISSIRAPDIWLRPSGCFVPDFGSHGAYFRPGPLA